MKMSSRWIKHCRTDEERKEVIACLASAKPAFDLLYSLVEQEKASNYKIAKNKEAYEKASWPFMQADANGEERAYNSILKLLTITYEE